MDLYALNDEVRALLSTMGIEEPSEEGAEMDAHDGLVDDLTHMIADRLAGKVAPDLTGTVANLRELARRLEDERDAARSVVRDRLEYLRGEIHAERISQSEVIELQNLAPHIDDGDAELLEWAGVPEHGCRNGAHFPGCGHRPGYW